VNEVWGASVVEAGGTRAGMRLRTSAPERLRAYLQALGIRADIDNAGLVAFELPGNGFGVNSLLQSWALVNDVEVVVGQAASVPAPAPFLVPFAPPRLGDMLVRKGLITEEQLQQALVQSRESGERLGEVLLNKKWLFEDELARTLAGQLNLPYVNLAASGVDRRVAAMIPASIGHRFAVIPIGVRAGSIRVAFADPTDEEALQAVGTHLSTIDPVVADLSDIRSAWRHVESYAPSGTP
jgi:Type II secretion system (T2SS), protein E, N-terminal domain